MWILLRNIDGTPLPVNLDRGTFIEMNTQLIKLYVDGTTSYVHIPNTTENFNALFEAIGLEDQIKGMDP